MKAAIIDLGTSTFHLLIAEFTEQGYKEVVKKRFYVKLGEGGLQNGITTISAQQRAVKAMIAFKKFVDQYQVKHIRAVATSAMRSSTNATTLLKSIETQTGIAVEIISGIQEATYISRGVKEAIQLTQEIALIMDIGGGSVEFILCNESKTLWEQSFEIGSQRLVDNFHQHDPISSEELDRLEQYLQQKLSPLLYATKLYQPSRLIGTSGAFETLLSMYQAKKRSYKNSHTAAYDLPIRDFEQIYQHIHHKSYEDRLGVAGLIKQRADMIVVNTAFIRFILKQTDISRITVSSYGIKEGLFFKMLESNNFGSSH